MYVVQETAKTNMYALDNKGVVMANIGSRIVSWLVTRFDSAGLVDTCS
jgi:hypothetical protein